MKKAELLILMLCLGVTVFANDADNPPQEGWKVVGQKLNEKTCEMEDILEWKVGCVAGSISLGSSRPGSMIESSRLQLYAEAPSPSLYTPQGLTFVGNWSMHSVSTDRTEAGAPRTVHLFDPDGEPIQYSFEDDESMGLPNDHLIDERRFTRLFMVDAEGWATLTEPAYYDLYTKDGDLYRFYAYPGSEHYLELCYYKTASGYEETLGDMGVDIIKSSVDVLRQVRSATRLADIVIESSSKYRVDCYESTDVGSKDTNGLYTVNIDAEPFESWVVENPEPATQENLRVTKISNGYTNVVTYSYAVDAEEWTMIKGDGMQKTVKSKMHDDSYQVELETYTVQNAIAEASAILIKRIQRNEMKAFGNVITETVDYYGDNESDKLVTAYDYHEDSSDERQYGQLSRVEEPTGKWKEMKYEDPAGRKTQEISPFAGPFTKINDLSYAPHVNEGSALAYDARPRLEQTLIDNIAVGKVMRAFTTNTAQDQVQIEEKAVDPVEVFGSENNLRTVKTYYGSGGYLKGRLKSVQHPDGLLDSYTYEKGNYTATADPSLCGFASNSSGLAWRETIVHGTTNSPSGVAWRTTKEVTVKDQYNNEVLSETYVYTGLGYERIGWTVKEFDVQGHAIETYYSDGRHESARWESSCCGKTSETDVNGVEKVYSYDPLGRPESMVQLDTNGETGVTAEFTYDAADRLLSSTIADSEQTTSLSINNEYDLAGRKTKETDPTGLVTEYDYQNGGRTVTEVLPGGADKIVDNYLDGQTNSVTGDGVIPKYYDYGVYEDHTTWAMEYVGTTNSPQWTRTVKDGADRIIRIEKPAFGGGVLTNRYHYNLKGQLERIERPEQADILYAYTEEGLQYRTALDMNENGVIDLNGPDRVSEKDEYYEEDGSGSIWQVSISKLYAEENSASVTTTAVKKVRMTGLGTSSSNGKLTSEIISADIRGNQTVTKKYIDRVAKTVTEVMDVPDSTNNVVTVTVNGLVRSKTTKTGLTYTYQYDALNRLTGVTDPRTGQVTLGYNEKGQVEWKEDAASNKTWFAYDEDTGRKVAETNALGNSTLYSYNDRGQIVTVGGSAKYPVEYDYDDYGRMTALYTLRGATNGWDITRWYYDEGAGLVTNKVYADGNGTEYSYTARGQLASRKWARGITTDYRYDPAGSLTNTTYSDGTPSVSIAYNRLGQKKQVIDASGTNTFAYDSGTLALTNETQLSSFSVNRSYDTRGRASGITLGEDYAVSYVYDTLGRFTSVSSSVDSVSSVVNYSYLPDSELLAGYTNNFGLAVQYGFEDHRNLKTEVLNQFGTNTVSSFDYLYDEIGRRTQRIDTQFSTPDTLVTNVFAYNDRNELIGAVMPVLSGVEGGTNTYSYTYDNIGNRQSCSVGSQSQSYLVNELNQYLSVTSVTSVVNLQYDLDGNLTNDGVRAYTWNGENRLTAVEPLSPTNGALMVQFAYDAQGRRIQKDTYQLITNNWELITETKFLYDAWNLIAEIDNLQSQISNRYVWGPDLSQTLQKAGGIGGLLSANINGTNGFYGFDANGNVTDMVDTNGAVQAHYEYDPYGRMTVQDGALAEVNPFRFSTKYQDDETGLYYYGHRYYSPEFGRWTSKDPFGERGGVNLYSFCFNNTASLIDPLGLCSRPPTAPPTTPPIIAPPKTWEDYQYEGGGTLHGGTVAPGNAPAPVNGGYGGDGDAAYGWMKDVDQSGGDDTE